MIGGARGTNEDAYAWAKLAKGVLGTDNVDAQLGDGLEPSVLLGLPRATIDEAAAATTLILLGPDVKEELPVLYLRLRDSAQRRRTRLLELSTHDTGLTPYAWKCLRYRPGEQGALVAALLADGAKVPDGTGITDADLADVREQLAKGRVRRSRRPALDRRVLGLRRGRRWPSCAPGCLAPPSCRACDAATCTAPSTSASRPGCCPVGCRSTRPARRCGPPGPRCRSPPGLDTAGILRAAADGHIGCLILLGADPLSDFPDRGLAQRGLEGVGTIVAVDTFLSASSQLADVVLAAAAFGEKAGTTTNLEGRVSTLSQKVTPSASAHADWIIAADLAFRLGHDLGFTSVAGDVGGDPGCVGASRGDGGGRPGPPPRRPPHRGPATSSAPQASGSAAPPLKGYGFRLATGRKLYDAGVAVANSPSLAGLAPSDAAAPEPLGRGPPRRAGWHAGAGRVAQWIGHVADRA